VVALAECGTHAFLAAEVGAYSVGEKTLAHRLYQRLRPDELCTADRNFYSFDAWDLASRTGAGLVSNILDPAAARADELAAAYHQRWEQETGNDQLKTHLRGSGKALRSKLPTWHIRRSGRGCWSTTRSPR